MKFLSAHLLFFAMCVLPGVSFAQSASLDGVWSGAGYLKPNDGDRESVRCRVQYHKETEKVFRVSANCVTSASKVSQTGSILKVGSNVYVGEFHNPDFDVSGRIRINVAGSTQTVTMTSRRGSGSLTLTRR